MERLYTGEDIERWQSTTDRVLGLLHRRLGNEPFHSEDAQGLSMLGLTHEDIAFTKFALGESQAALEHLKTAVQCRLRIYELHSKGVVGASGYIRTGDFSTVLTGYASRDLKLASQFANNFSIDRLATGNSPKDSNYIGEALKAICSDEYERALQLISRPKPSIDPQFAGYVECLESIASQDKIAFEAAVRRAEAKWHAFMRNTFRGHPQAVCFLGGLGFQRLAEAKLGVMFDLGFCCEGIAK